MHVWSVLHATRWKYRKQKLRKKSSSAQHRTTLLGCVFAMKACIDNRKKNLLSTISLGYQSTRYTFDSSHSQLVTPPSQRPVNSLHDFSLWRVDLVTSWLVPYLLHISSQLWFYCDCIFCAIQIHLLTYLQYAELWPINGLDLLGSLEHPSKFQWVSRLGFVTAQTSLNGRQENFARCLPVSCTGILYVHFQGLLHPNGIFPAANSLCVQIFCFLILAVLLYGTRTLCISQTLWCSAEDATYNNNNNNPIYKAPECQKTSVVLGWAAIMLGIGPHSTLLMNW